MGPPLDMTHQSEEPSRVGVSFVNDYYKQLSSDPLGLVKYYSKDTQFSYCEIGEVDHDIFVGAADIAKKLNELGLKNVKTHISSVKCQSSVNGSVLVVVHGALSNDSSQPQSFNQTFVLAKSARKQKTFYVVNDFLIFTPSSTPAYDPEDEQDQDYETDVVEDAPVQESEHQTTPEPAVDNWADETPSEGEEAVQEAPVPVPAPVPAPAPTPVAVAAPAPTPVPVPAVPVAPVVREPEKVIKETPKKAAEAPKPTEVQGPYVINSFADALKHGTKAAEPKQRKTVITDKPERTATAVPKRPAAPAKEQPTEEQKAAGGHRRLPPSATRPSVYVAKVPEGTTDEELWETFTAFGPVTHVRNRPMKRIAFVDFGTTEAQGQAIEAGSKGLVTIRGKEIVVQAQRRDPELDNLVAPARGRGRENREPRGRGARGQEAQKSSASQ